MNEIKVTESKKPCHFGGHSTLQFWGGYITEGWKEILVKNVGQN